MVILRCPPLPKTRVNTSNPGKMKMVSACVFRHQKAKEKLEKQLFTASQLEGERPHGTGQEGSWCGVEGVILRPGEHGNPTWATEGTLAELEKIRARLQSSSLEKLEWWAEKQGVNSVTRPRTKLWSGSQDSGKCLRRPVVRGGLAALRPGFRIVCECSKGLVQKKASKLETEGLKGFSACQKCRQILKFQTHTLKPEDLCSNGSKGKGRKEVIPSYPLAKQLSPPGFQERIALRYLFYWFLLAFVVIRWCSNEEPIF